MTGARGGELAVGALIGAYQEDDEGGLRALLPLSGRTLIEYQVRCASAAGAAPIVVVVERVPQALQDAFERLRFDGVGVFPVSAVEEAVSRFEAGAMILVIGDGIAPPADLVIEPCRGAGAGCRDGSRRRRAWRIRTDRCRIALGGSGACRRASLGSTAAMLGDWDLQSTLAPPLDPGRSVAAAGRRRSEPLLVETRRQLERFPAQAARRFARRRTDWVSRYCSRRSRNSRPSS